MKSFYIPTIAIFVIFIMLFQTIYREVDLDRVTSIFIMLSGVIIYIVNKLILRRL